MSPRSPFRCPPSPPPTPGPQEHLPAAQGAAAAGDDQEIQPLEGRGGRAAHGDPHGGAGEGGGEGRRAGLCVCGLGTAWRPAGLEPSVPAQELLLRANIEELRCAVPRSRGEPQLQVTPAPAPTPWAGLHGQAPPCATERPTGGRGPETPAACGPGQQGQPRRLRLLPGFPTVSI